MKFLFYLILTYAGVLVVGGLIGFIVAGSEISLWMGGIFGLLLVISAFTLRKNLVVALSATTFLSLLLTLFFSYRFYTTGGWMPGGVLMILSALVLIVSFTYKKISDQ